MELLIGFLLGLSITSLVFTHMIRRYVRNKVALRNLISEMYHKDLLPEICRAEGLVYLATRENHHEYAKMALKEIQIHKEKVLALIQKYHKFQ